MKNKTLLILTVLLVAAAAGFIFSRSAGGPGELPAPPSSPTAEVKTAAPSTKVITLYQKGEGESDLAAFVSRELAAKYGTRAVFRAINVLDDPQIAEYYGVSSLPAVVFISPSGKVYKKYEGYLDKGKILSLLSSVKD